jgi:intein-encoded DNA endonuclease-like protein
MLTEAKNGKSTGYINSFLDAYAFLTKFFDMPNYAENNSVKAVKRFVEKSTSKISNVKTAFGSDEVRNFLIIM